MSEYVPGAIILALGLVFIGFLADRADRSDKARARYREAECAGLYSLARTNADSLAIATDGCAAYLGREE